MEDDEQLLTGNENMLLHFDDSDNELHVGDRVLINDATVAVIREEDGRRVLSGWPNDEIVYTLELIDPLPPPDEDWPDAI